jgi:hypothetical protein
MDNIFIDDRVTTKGSVRYGKFVVPSIGMNAVLGDFGFANMQADGFRNPKVQSGEYKYDYGIATDNNPMYDIHFFLNDLYRTTDNQKVKQFIKRHIPAEYLRSESPVVQNNRLRYGVNHSRLPTFDKLLSDKFFRFFSSKGDTVVPPINSFPRNIKIATATKKTPSPAPRVSRKSPIQTLSPTKPVLVKRVVKRPIIPSPKKASPPKFRPEQFKAPPVKRNARKAGVVLIKNVVKFVNGSSRGKKCESFKKAEIVAKAKSLGITGVDKVSKEKICAMIKNALA